MTKGFQTLSDVVQLNTVHMIVNRFLMRVSVSTWVSVQSSGPDSSPDWGHFFMLLRKTLYSHRFSLHLRGKSDSSLFLLWVTLQWTSIPYSLCITRFLPQRPRLPPGGWAAVLEYRGYDPPNKPFWSHCGPSFQIYFQDEVVQELKQIYAQTKRTRIGTCS